MEPWRAKGSSFALACVNSESSLKTEPYIYTFVCVLADGGTDTLPNFLGKYDQSSRDRATHVFVAARSEDDVMHALICCQRREDILWIFGLRTDEEYRGMGLASSLMEYAQDFSTTFFGSDISCLMASTIEANTTMLGILHRKGYVQHALVRGWPTWEVVRKSRTVFDPTLHSHGLINLMELRSRVEYNTTEYGASRWFVCNSMDMLVQSLKEVKSQRLGANDATEMWMPGEYEIWPLQNRDRTGISWTYLSELINAGLVSVFKRESCLGILALQKDLKGNFYASLVCNDDFTVLEAVKYACTSEPSCMKFYIDDGGILGKDSIVEIHGGSNDFLIFRKEIHDSKATVC